MRWIQFGFDFGWLTCPRFREDDVVGGLWIPAFAGMTAAGVEVAKNRPIRARFVIAFLSPNPLTPA